MRACGLWLLFTLVAGPLLAQPATFDVRGKPLDEALRLARERASFSYTNDPDLVADRTSRCVTSETRAELVLACVLQGTGIVFSRLPSGLYVLVRAPAALPAARMRGRVIDAETGLPLPDASVLLPGMSRGVTAGSEGVFVIDGLPAGTLLSLIHI